MPSNSRPSAPKAPVRVTPAVPANPLGLKTAPFAGIAKTKTPAQNTHIPQLTAHVALAKARDQRAANGGLLTPSQEKAEASAAAQILSHTKNPQTRTPTRIGGVGVQRAPSRNAKANEPPSTSLPAPKTPAPKRPAQTPPAKLPAWLANPVTLSPSPTSTPSRAPSSLPNTTRGATNLPASAAAPRGAQPLNPQTAPLTPGPNFSSLGENQSWGHALRNVAHGIDLGLGTAAASAEAGLGIGSPAILTKSALNPKNYVTSAQAGARLAGAGMSLPKIIPSIDLVAPAGAATKGPVTPQQLVAAGLSPAQTQKFEALALKNGWHPEELQGLVGLDLIKHAYSKPPPLPVRLAKNFASDVITTGSLPTALVGLGQQAVSGHAEQAAKELGGVVSSQIGGLASDPVGYAESHPYYAFSMLGGVGKSLGEAGRLMPGEAAARDAELAGQDGRILNRGTLDKNLYVAAGQHISDIAAAKSTRYAKHLDAQSVDQVVRDVTNQMGPDHHVVQHTYAMAKADLPKGRAEILQAYQHAGGRPERVLAFYEKRAAEDGPKSAAAGQVKFWRDKVVPQTRTLNDADHRFLLEHAAIAHNTSSALIAADRFGDTAAEYRAHEPLIISAAHAGDPEAGDLMKLREDYLSPSAAKLSDEDHAALEGAYADAVQRFAARSDSPMPPVRVAYSQPRGIQPQPFRPAPGAKQRFTDRFAKQQASSGESFSSGRYLIDSNTPLKENIAAQRMGASIGARNAVFNRLGTPAAAGDTLPKGSVFVSDRNMRALRQLQNDLQDNPVSAHDYYAQEAETRGKMSDLLSASTVKPTEGQTWSVPRGEKGTFLPEGAYDRIMDYTRPQSRGAFDKAMRQYQRVLISTSPSTILGNVAGSAPMAMAAGAGPKSFNMALKSLHDPSLVPASLTGRGMTAALNAADATNLITKGMAQMRRPSIWGEDLTRHAAYWAKALKPMGKEARKAGVTIEEYARSVAKGETNPQLQNAALDWAMKFTGDMAKPEGKLGREAGRYILFHNWLGHVAKLMLYTLPVEHPGRMALINVLSQYGEQYRKEHGAWPSWMDDFLPLGSSKQGANTFTRAMSVGQLTPQNTIGGFLDTLGSQTTAAEKLSQLVNPLLGIPLATGIQEIKNKYGDSKPVPLGRFAAHQIAYSLPYVAKFEPSTGYTQGSIPFISPQRKTYKDPTAPNNAYVSNAIPFDQRPGARPVSGWLGDLSRLAGLNLYDVPNRGPINRTANKTEEYYDAPKTARYGSYPK